MNTTLPLYTVTSIAAYRISFTEQASNDDSLIASLDSSPKQFALCQAIELDEIDLATADSDKLYFLFVPNSMKSGFNWQDWIVAPSTNSTDTPLELLVKADRIVKMANKVAFVGSTERLKDTLSALTHFYYWEEQTKRIERELELNWEPLKKDIPLTHGINPASLKEWPGINARTAWITNLNIQYVRLQAAIKRPAKQLTLTSKKIFTDLIELSELETRLEALEGQVEIFHDMYAVANDRLSEYNYYLQEFRLELWIILLLVLEVLCMAVELWKFTK